ncbi:MAG: methyltransferase [Acidimicrobiia bacterium]|nr:methyltransferase [Acidimicrobiia bacterium]
MAQDLAATRAFFATRAATWEDRFPDDDPAYERAVAALRPASGTVVLDVACGTARAAPFLRRAVGPSGIVVAVDATWEMLHAARVKGRNESASLALADGMNLPLADGSVAAVLAAGYLTHVGNMGQALLELARLTVVGGRLAVFHPIGRAALAARHGHPLSEHDPLDPRQFGPGLNAAGWRLESAHDESDYYLVIAERQDREVGDNR